MCITTYKQNYQEWYPKLWHTTTPIMINSFWVATILDSPEHAMKQKQDGWFTFGCDLYRRVISTPIMTYITWNLSNCWYIGEMSTGKDIYIDIYTFIFIWGSIYTCVFFRLNLYLLYKNKWCFFDNLLLHCRTSSRNAVERRPGGARAKQRVMVMVRAPFPHQRRRALFLGLQMGHSLGCL